MNEDQKYQDHLKAYFEPISEEVARDLVADMERDLEVERNLL